MSAAVKLKLTIRLGIFFAALGAADFPLGAEEIKLQPGHRLFGRMLTDEGEKAEIAAERIELQRSDITALKIGDAEAKGSEFFAKLRLKDGTQVFAHIQKLPNGDVLIPRHPILGDNYLVTKSSIQSLTAAGEATITLQSIGDIRGFISSEGPAAILVEPAPGTTILIPRHLLIENPAKKTAVKKAKVQTMYLGVTGGLSYVAGNLATFIKSGYHIGAEYGYSLPGVFSILGSATLAAHFESYSGDKLTIQYYRFYAGVRRFFILTGPHSLFARLSTGVNNEKLTGSKTFAESVFVAGVVAGWGYAFKFDTFTFFAENNLGYIYDSSNPLLTIGIDLGVLYGF